MKIQLGAILVGLGLLSGCTTTKFSTSASPATIKEQYRRDGLTDWGGTKVFRVGNIEMGYAYASGTTFTVDPGPTVISVWYYGNHDGFKGIFTQTNNVDIPLTLEPNGRYEVRGEPERYAPTMKFSVVNLATGEVVATTQDVPVVPGPSRVPQPKTIYIYY